MLGEVVGTIIQGIPYYLEIFGGYWTLVRCS